MAGLTSRDVVAVTPEEFVIAIHCFRTGKIGAGKMFVVRVEQAIRSRNGETGKDAI